MNPIFKAQARKGKIIYENPEMVRKHLIFNEGEVEVIIRKPRSQRSINQNNYYWGVVLKLLSDHTGHSSDELHEIMKTMFNSKRVEIETKSGLHYKVIGQSTTRLSTVKMEDYLANIRQWASLELGVSIPEPNEVEE